MKIDSKWTKLGLLVGSDSKILWLAGGSGPLCAIANPNDPSIVDLYVSGRDSQNRSGQIQSGIGSYCGHL